MLRLLTQSTALATLASCLFATLANAQNSVSSTYEPYNGPVETSVSYPGTSPNAAQCFSSTLQEGVLRGTASVMQAYYNGQLTHAQARILMAEARAREAQLRVTKVALAQQRRQLVSEEREHLRQQRLERDLLGQQLDLARMPIRYAEYRLEAAQFDRETGEIRWPTALDHPTFATSTCKLQALFFELALADRTDARFLQTQIAEACQQLQQELRDARACLHLNAEQNQHYLACQRYVLGLKYEAMYGGLHGSTFSLAAQ